MSYDAKTVEQKWQQKWRAEAPKSMPDPAGRDPHYLLAMFPYPSGEGLHVGHVGIYTATDVLARYWRLRGKAVFAPMGWDAFGLPAENYAIKKGIPPRETTDKNVQTFRRQMDSVGFSFDWQAEINTSNPDYYRWTQWMFLQLYKQGLAYQSDAAVNWCESCQTVLANEQVVDGQCERCQSEVVQKNMRQWFFKITQYADELLAGVDNLDWPEKIKQAQRNWLGKSAGSRITFSVQNSDQSIEVFTTRADTLYGCTYLLLAPEHPLLGQITSSEQKEAVTDYVKQAAGKTELERVHLEKSKTGVFTGAYAINPINKEVVPVWVADYVVMGYGTGAIMAVPAHDERDHAFAIQYNLPIKQVIASRTDKDTVRRRTVIYTDYGVLINSGSHSDLPSDEAIKKITEAVGGRLETMWRLRDWLVSRQRYWGAPIPIIHCPKCGPQPVPEDQLPVLLPEDVDFKPTGHSPLADSTSFNMNVCCPKCGGDAKREADTMDTFVCSSWYYLRFPSHNVTNAPFDPDKTKQWLPVNEYVGGAEHAVLHLLYSRFFTKALRDGGHLSFDEPFKKLRTIGLILGPDNQKMSKSRGNVINPDEVVDEYGADALRLHELFLGPFSEEKPWKTSTIKGVTRFIDTVYRLNQGAVGEKGEETEQDALRKKSLHQAIKKITVDIADYRFNTALAALMSLSHDFGDWSVEAARQWRVFLQLLSPLAPHLVSECWSDLGESSDVHALPWPTYDEAELVETEATWTALVNGRLRATFAAAIDLTEDDAKRQAEGLVKGWLEGKKTQRVIFVPGKLVNFVVTD